MKYCIVSLLFILYAVSFTACKDKPADLPLSSEKMESLLYDYQLLQATTNYMSDSINIRKRVMMDAMLKKYGLTQREFDNVLSWYAKHPDEFAKVYANVEKKFANPKGASTEQLQVSEDSTKKSSLPMGEAQAEIKNYWKGAYSYLLSINGRRSVTFSQKVDAPLQAGDRLIWHASTTWIYREGLKSASFVLSLVYDNDSIAHRSMIVSTTGKQVLIIPVDKRKVKRIQGFIQQNGNNDTGVKLLYISKISLEIEKGVVEMEVSDAQRRADSIAKRELMEQQIQDSLLKPSKEPHFR